MSNSSEKRTQAIEWLLRLQQGQEPSQASVKEWEQWIEDTAHQADFDRVAELWTRTRTIGPLPLPDAEELAADDYDGSEPIAQWSARRAACVEAAPEAEPTDILSDVVSDDDPLVECAPQMRQPRRWHRRLAIAAAASIAALAWFIYPQMRSTLTIEPQLHETGLAEHRTIQLQDGSEVLLGARTSLWVTYTPQRRIIVLDRGEALFDVARDPQRPFAVYAGYGTITAVGTSFSVQRNEEQVKVVVAEGVVRVEPRTALADDERAPSGSVVEPQSVVATLTKGQQVSYDERGSGKISIDRVDTELATAWRDGRLQYIDEPLHNVVADVNRYSIRQVVLDGPQTHHLRFTGVVFQENADEWIDQLTDVFPILEVADIDAEHVVFRSRADGVDARPTVP